MYSNGALLVVLAVGVLLATRPGASALLGERQPDALGLVLAFAQAVLGVDIDSLLQPDQVFLALQIAREATSNIIRHAGASSVLLKVALEAGTLTLTVSDDGCGFDPGATRGLAGHGLRNMVERARSLGARISILSQPGRGTEVRISIAPRQGAW